MGNTFSQISYPEGFGLESEATQKLKDFKDKTNKRYKNAYGVVNRMDLSDQEKEGGWGGGEEERRYRGTEVSKAF